MKDEHDSHTQELFKNFFRGKAMQATQFIDDVKDSPIDADSILTDDQLGRGGLVKIEAFVRTKTSAAAARKAKQREHQKAEGIRTVTLTVPESAKEQLKAIAAEISSGKSLADAVQGVTSHGQVTNSDIYTQKYNESLQRIGVKVVALKGWKRLIAKAIGIL